jgi:hypothetical protein
MLPRRSYRTAAECVTTRTTPGTSDEATQRQPLPHSIPWYKVHGCPRGCNQPCKKPPCLTTQPIFSLTASQSEHHDCWSQKYHPPPPQGTACITWWMWPPLRRTACHPQGAPWPHSQRDQHCPPPQRSRSHRPWDQKPSASRQPGQQHRQRHKYVVSRASAAHHRGVGAICHGIRSPARHNSLGSNTGRDTTM